MPYLHLDRSPVLHGHVTLPLKGRLVGDVLLSVDGAAPLRGQHVMLSFQDGTAFRCTVERAGPEGGFYAVRVVGGSGGLSQDVPARAYRGLPAALLVRELLQDCGETPGALELPGTPPHWIRPAGPAHEALAALLARAPGYSWRVQGDGQVWVGRDAWPDVPGVRPVDREDAAQGTYTVPADATLRPGVRVTLGRGNETVSKRVTRVVHHIGPQLRAELSTGDGEDPGPEGLARVVQHVMGFVDYLALYPCTILRDHGDHHLDLQPEHPQLPALSRVPLVPPIPGSRVKVQAGGTALLMFQQADPSRPLVVQVIGTLELLDVTTGKGQRLLLDDDRGTTTDDLLYANPRAALQDQGGQVLELQARPGREQVRLRDRSGQQLVLDAAQTTVTLQGFVTTTVTASTVQLGDGVGQPVARVGDSVQDGVILSGSSRVHSG